MKKLFLTVNILIFILLFITPAKAGDYHIKGKNLFCSDCHTIHFSQDGKIPDEPRPWGTSPQGHLLKDVTSEMCLMCHDGEHFQAPDVFHPTPHLSSAGYFGPDPNSVCGHTLNTTTPPPGYSGTWDMTLSCTSCHDPHGNTYYRNLRERPCVSSLDSEKFPVSYFTGSLPAGNEDKAIQQYSADPNDFSPHYGPDNIVYRKEGSRGGEYAGLSLWCSGCHPEYNQEDAGQGDRPWMRHPTYGLSMSEASENNPLISVSRWSDLASHPPTVSPLDEDRGQDRPFCGTCHKAHGSSRAYGLLWDNPETSQREDGRFMRDTCQACHHIGAGFYEPCPHADPSYGVYRVKGFDRGECEHCHQQHGRSGLYDHNLFTENNNSLCLTAGCHLEEPSSYPLSDKKLPVGSQARINEIINGKDFRGYFEANKAGQRLRGLDFRGRWPGASVYQDSQFSLHGQEPMPDNGSCKNCHSPHGTEAPFDMLKAPYSGTINSGSSVEGLHNYQLCFNCHSQNGPWAPDGMRPETRMIADYYNQSINNDKYSGHQIQSQTGFPQRGDQLSCSNCHNPHGSRGHSGQPNRHLLSDERPGWNGLKDTLTDPNSSRRFCFGCHIPSDKTEGEWGNPVVEGIAMKSIPAFPAHETSSNESCHACHGSSYSGSTSENVHHPSPGSCNGCHADQGIMAFEDGGSKSFYTGPHAYHTDIDASSEKRRKYAFSCEVCHAKLNLGTETAHGNKRASDLDPNASIAQYAEVYFHDDTIDWKSLPIHQRSYRYRSLFHNPYENNSSVRPGYVSKGYIGVATDPIDPNITWSDQSQFIRNSCYNIWCHSNANPLSLHDTNPGDGNYRENSYQARASFPLTWDDHDGDRCNNCHGFTNLVQPSEVKYYLSSLHRRHIGTLGREKITCGRCHVLTCESASNILFRDDQRDKDGYFYHVNGQKDIAFQTEVNPGGAYDYTSHTCSSLYCHPKDVSWDTAGSERCASCHPVYADDQNPDTIATGGHYVHLTAGWGPHIICSDCHAGPSSAEGQVDEGRSSANTVVSKDDPGWEPDMWKGYTIFFRELASRPAARTIMGNTKDTLFVENLPEVPAGAFSIICPGNLTHCDGKVNFNDGLPLAATAACDTCHSPDGDYDGVNNQTIGAKTNWKTGVYSQTGTYLRLSEGKERWCVGCHDKKPANSRRDGSGVPAPNIAGDEQAFTLYGRGYGYFKTGHGLSASENYPASQDSGAGTACTDCHDVGQSHLDHAHRSYSAEQNNYRVGYRLQKVEEIEPMDIPRTWYDGLPNNNPNNNPRKDWQDFALCFTCHDRHTLLGDGGSDDEYYQDPLQTNFFNNTYRNCPSENTCYPLNLHTIHLMGRFNGKNLDWASSWGNAADSSLSCPACHNVHGSPSPRMMRHGELISTPNTYDKVPGLNFTYFVNFENFPAPPKDITLADSSGGEVFPQFKAGPGSVAVNQICNTCHRGWCWYFRTPQVDPKILSARAMNSSYGAHGIDDGDQLIITFSVPTNGRSVVTEPEDVPDIFKVYEDANQNEAALRSWGSIDHIEWSDAGGNTDDTLVIVLTKDPPPTIAPGHLLVIRSVELKDLQTNEPIISSKPITGTFDCSLARAYAQDKSGESGIQAGDQVTLEFLGSTSGNFWPEYCVTAKNIDQSLPLNKSHSWGQLLGDPSWSSNHGENDTLTIIMGSGASLASGDIITLAGAIRDENGNPIIGSAIVEGSFDPPLWSTPTAIYDFSGQGPPGGEAMKSIDGNLQTYWHPAGPAGWIVYDLAAEHQVTQVRIFSNDILDAEGNRISGIKVSVTIWVSSNSSINDPSFADPPVIAKWEVINESGWHESPLFEPPHNGRYIKIEASKRGGPLINFFSEVEFKGIAPPAPPS